MLKLYSTITQDNTVVYFKVHKRDTRSVIRSVSRPGMALNDAVLNGIFRHMGHYSKA